MEHVAVKSQAYISADVAVAEGNNQHIGEKDKREGRLDVLRKKRGIMVLLEEKKIT